MIVSDFFSMPFWRLKILFTFKNVNYFRPAFTRHFMVKFNFCKYGTEIEWDIFSVIQKRSHKVFFLVAISKTELNFFWLIFVHSFSLIN